jgi:hypothetical protein
MSKLSTLMVLALLGGCGSKHPLSTGDGGAGITGSAGAGGAGTGGGGGSGGAVATGGSGGSASGGSGGGAGGTSGPGGIGGNLGGILDGGLGGLLQDGGLGGLLDSGIIGGCPANPANQPCGGAGSPMYCYTPASDGGAPAACACIAMRYVCLGQGGLGGDGGMGVGGTPCPDNAAGMSCPAPGAVCTRAGGGLCGCLAQGGLPAWRCLP